MVWQRHDRKAFCNETISLASPRGRLTAFLILSVIIYSCHYHWLDHLSLLGDLGFSHAPSIGLTRAYWLLLHLQFLAAWHRNRLIYLVLAIGLPMLAVDGYQLLRVKQSPHSGCI